MLNDKSILITGGTGSFGKACTKAILERFKPKRLIILSRDELKQYEMMQSYPLARYSCIRFFLGDVRDKDRLYRAFRDTDYVIHAAALKQVPQAEYNPFEAIKTNVLGAQNIIDAAIDCGVKRVVALSTDKAANPINLYGATKLCSDKLFIAGNSYTGNSNTTFSVVRYGNVLGSRGSVIPMFMKQRESGVLSITDDRMTRFWITLDHGVNFVLQCMERMIGGEVFVPKIPSMRIADLARAVCPECRVETVGIRPGEKLHEVMIPLEESRKTYEFDDYFVIRPDIPEMLPLYEGQGWRTVHEEFEYNSHTNEQWLSVQKLRELIATL
ncbi:MAG: polysaccharide biosynthesis protein [Desulfovibrionaceae bacterium]|nr:MAG: polysaccharide biosynthesis protein [Desulfovibrionaceae bacterium]